MSKLLLLLAFLVSFSASAEDKKFNTFGDIMFKTLEHRQEMVSSKGYVDQILSKDYTLSGADIVTINSEFMKRAKLSEKQFNFLDQSIGFLKRRVSRKRIPSRKQLKDIMMSLALGVTMSDSFLNHYLKFHKSKKLYRLLNEKDTTYSKEKGSFKKRVKEFYSLRNRKKLRRAVKHYTQEYLLNIHSFDSDKDGEEFATISRIIQDSFTFRKLIKQNFWNRVGEFFNFISNRMVADTRGNYILEEFLSRDFVFVASKWFGNFAGKFQSRKGMLYHSDEFEANAIPELQPLDIILEKTPFRATDRFIPGFWGHAAIYIGTEEQLKALKIWDHPVVKKHHKSIRKGKTIAEALRPKVVMNSLRDFSDIDDFALLKYRNSMSDEMKREHIVRALSQIGKDYDFGFDVESQETIVCSELHYITYTGLKFDTERIIGRQTISVDQVAEQGIEGMPLVPTILYLKGKEITENIQAKFDDLLLTKEQKLAKEEEEEEEVNKKLIPTLAELEERFSKDAMKINRY